MKLLSSWMSIGALSSAALLCAQSNVAVVAPPAKVIAHAGQAVSSKIAVELLPGYHCNSNTPSEDYLIPLRLAWLSGPLQVVEVVYPHPKMEKYAFSPKPLSVFTGNFDIVTKFKVPAGALAGETKLTGKLRYQACTDKLCLPPRSIDITLPVQVVK